MFPHDLQKSQKVFQIYFQKSIAQLNFVCRFANTKSKHKDMKTKIEIRNFPRNTFEVDTFPTEKMAQQRFNELADMHNLDVFGDMAGGIGFDWKIELVEE